MSNRIVIGLPLYGWVQAEWVQQFIQFQSQVARFNQTTKQSFAGIISTINPYISTAMNEIIREALTSDQWDYFLSIEHDMVMPADLMERLQDYNPKEHPIVGILYFGRVQEDQRPVAGYLNEFRRLNAQELDSMLREPGLYPVDWVPMGCTAIHRSVFENWEKRTPWFRQHETPKGVMGHDVDFCTRAKKQGFPIHLDTKISAGHLGTWKSTLVTHMATRKFNTEIGEGWDPRDISTSMSKVELDRLEELAAGKRVLEIGARIGASTVRMAKVAELVHSVDWHKGDKWHDAIGGQGDTLGAFWASVNFHGVRDKVVPLVGSSKAVLPGLASGQYDFVFIDGDHSYEGVSYDLRQACRLVKPGGVIALHDYKREDQVPEYGEGDLALGITKAVEELGVPFTVVDTLAIISGPWAKPWLSAPE